MKLPRKLKKGLQTGRISTSNRGIRIAVLFDGARSKGIQFKKNMVIYTTYFKGKKVRVEYIKTSKLYNP